MRARKTHEQKDRYECTWSSTYQEWQVIDNEKPENHPTLSNTQMIQMLVNEVAMLKKRVAKAEQAADRAETNTISRSLPL